MGRVYGYPPLTVVRARAAKNIGTAAYSGCCCSKTFLNRPWRGYSTVTVFARLRGLSMSRPRRLAMA
jgi:hypothetical protein